MADVKQSRLVQLFYNIPGAASTYHFLWAWFGAASQGRPGKKIFVIGITGTKGKTTTLELVNAILEAAGKRTALLSSLRVKIGGSSEKNQLGNSMPGHGYIQKFLNRAVREKCAYALVEVTSQGVAMHRHRFIDWNAGIITNLAPEHIEAHGSFENYRAAKLAFLKYVLEHGGKVFLNRDDKNYPFFEGALTGMRSSGKLMAASKEDWLRNYLPKLKPMRAVADGGAAPKFLLSGFNEENIAVAVAVTKELGVGDKIIEEALLNFRGVPGRMEFVTSGPFTAIVDYAHTPDSLEAAYRAARPSPGANYSAPRLICVLGAAGGGRDRWKRAEMGKVAAQYCDVIILTDEDPYDEKVEDIIAEIKAGVETVSDTPRETYVLLDRREAIKKAVGLMREGDVVIGTGKGSEDWIHVARGKKIPWNEKKVFEEVLGEKRRT